MDDRRLALQRYLYVTVSAHDTVAAGSSMYIHHLIFSCRVTLHLEANMRAELPGEHRVCGITW